MALWLNSRLSRLLETRLNEVPRSGTTPTMKSRPSREMRIRPRRRGAGAFGAGSGFTGRRSRRSRRPRAARHLEDAHFPLFPLEGEAPQALALEPAHHHLVGVL